MQASTSVTIEPARWPDDADTVDRLFREYAGSLGFDLCFQDFDRELATLPGRYVPPSGELLLASLDGQPVGCVAMRALEPGVCEMKRLYVRPEARGCGAGTRLTDAIIAAARSAGHRRMRLDTIAPMMGRAVELYQRRGFVEIAPYAENPIEGALYLELAL
ncbi:MAG: putative acetyltransferase [Gaiellales bacterium]|jgi:ribosomal protein S18 acetylase RimI-like enzyme|nr:putative acetyltransferase [Gaiellales bacterium]